MGNYPLNDVSGMFSQPNIENELDYDSDTSGNLVIDENTEYDSHTDMVSSTADVQKSHEKPFNCLVLPTKIELQKQSALKAFSMNKSQRKDTPPIVKKKTTFTKAQKAILEEEYIRNSTVPEHIHRKRIGKLIGMSQHTVKKWFKSRRAADKRKSKNVNHEKAPEYHTKLQVSKVDGKYKIDVFFESIDIPKEDNNENKENRPNNNLQNTMNVNSIATPTENLKENRYSLGTNKLNKMYYDIAMAQENVLEKEYKKHQHLKDYKHLEFIANLTCLPKNAVQVWFHDRKEKDRNNYYNLQNKHPNRRTKINNHRAVVLSTNLDNFSDDAINRQCSKVFTSKRTSNAENDRTINQDAHQSEFMINDGPTSHNHHSQYTAKSSTIREQVAKFQDHIENNKRNAPKFFNIEKQSDNYPIVQFSEVGDELSHFNDSNDSDKLVIDENVVNDNPNNDNSTSTAIQPGINKEDINYAVAEILVSLGTQVCNQSIPQKKCNAQYADRQEDSRQQQLKKSRNRNDSHLKIIKKTFIDFTNEQLAILEHAFKDYRLIDGHKQLQSVANSAGLPEHVVKDWFRDRKEYECNSVQSIKQGQLNDSRGNSKEFVVHTAPGKVRMNKGREAPSERRLHFPIGYIISHEAPTETVKSQEVIPQKVPKWQSKDTSRQHRNKPTCEKLTEVQDALLEYEFIKKTYVHYDYYPILIAKAVGLSEDSVRAWFKNREKVQKREMPKLLKPLLPLLFGQYPVTTVYNWMVKAMNHIGWNNYPVDTRSYAPLMHFAPVSSSVGSSVSSDPTTPKTNKFEVYRPPHQNQATHSSYPQYYSSHMVNSIKRDR